MRRAELLLGKCYAPKQIIAIVENDQFSKMFEALFHNWLMSEEMTTSATYWSDRFNDDKAFNLALFHLSKSGWIKTIVQPGRNWATIQFNGDKLLNWIDRPERLMIRKEFKFEKYMMNCEASVLISDTKTPQGIQNVGIGRKGIRKSGNSKFMYDTKYMTKYFDTIVLNTTKSIRAAACMHDLVVDGADYESVSL